MKIFCSLIVTLFLTGPLFAQGLQENLAGIVNNHVANFSFQGTVLVMKNQQVLFQSHKGLANKEFSIPIQDNTKFLVGSVSKQFTAALILKLESEGALNTNQLLSQYITVPDHWREITLHHLLTHTAGLRRDPQIVKKSYSRFHSLKTLVETSMEEPLLEDTKPGEKHIYSNMGYNILAFVAEKVSGKDFSLLMKEKIFDPSDLKQSGNYHQSLIVKNRASAHFSTPELEAKACCFDFSNAYGSGAIYSTAKDLWQWMQVLQTNKVLPESAREKFLKSYAPMGEKTSYGYGWIIDYRMSSKVIWHNGRINGYSSDLSWVPSQNLTVVILNNQGRIGEDGKALDSNLGGLRKSILSLFLKENSESEAQIEAKVKKNRENKTLTI